MELVYLIIKREDGFEPRIVRIFKSMKNAKRFAIDYQKTFKEFNPNNVEISISSRYVDE